MKTSPVSRAAFVWCVHFEQQFFERKSFGICLRPQSTSRPSSYHVWSVQQVLGVLEDPEVRAVREVLGKLCQERLGSHPGRWFRVDLEVLALLWVLEALPLRQRIHQMIRIRDRLSLPEDLGDQEDPAGPSDPFEDVSSKRNDTTWAEKNEVTNPKGQDGMCVACNQPNNQKETKKKRRKLLLHPQSFAEWNVNLSHSVYLFLLFLNSLKAYRGSIVKIKGRL